MTECIGQQTEASRWQRMLYQSCKLTYCYMSVEMSLPGCYYYIILYYIILYYIILL